VNISRCSICSGVVGLFAAALTLFAPTVFSSDIMRIEGAPVILTKAEEMVLWRSALGVGNATAITFTPLPASALKTLQEENSPESSTGSDRVLNAKPLKIGVGRNADTELVDAKLPALSWQDNGDGHIARWAVTSPEARGMRVALRLDALPDSAELRFSGSGAPERIIGVISGKEANALRGDNNVYWTPVTEGETQNIEIYLPSAVGTDDVKVRLNAVSHLFTSAQDGFNAPSLFKRSASCQVDVACKFNALGAAFQNVSRAVAKMITSDAIYTYSCSGTLLNNASGSQTPYFWSANHCLGSRIFTPAQQMANTLETHWFYEAAGCEGLQQTPDYRQLTGGAQILHNQASTDTLLLQLNNPPPAGAFFAGWDATYFSDGSFIGIHHPQGDNKKISTGNGAGAACNTRFSTSNLSGLNIPLLSLVSWTEGIVESGSSGSGLFTLSNGAYHLRGGLMGGAPNYCWQLGLPPQTSNNASCYFSLSLVYDSIKQYLGASNSSPNPSVFGPTREYSGQWVKADEDAWGLSVLMSFPGNSRYIFVPWYTYDSSGEASWYIFQGDSWSANDTITATVHRYKGSPWGTMPYNNNTVSYEDVGTATLTFTSATKAKFKYNIEGVQREINLDRLEGAPATPGKYTGQWAKTDEDAWGLSVLMTFPTNPNYIFVPWYTYDKTGKAVWYIFQSDVWSGESVTATVRRYKGPAWGTHEAGYNNRVSWSEVGTATLTFTSTTRAKFKYNVEGAAREIDLVKLE
jgi:hypothetical protein